MAGRPLMVRLLLAILLALLQRGAFVAAEGDETCSGIVPMKKRGEVVLITDFGGVGDGHTLNTEAFVSAVSRIEKRNAPGGTLLYVPSGVWLTGAFNLTSHMTLFLAHGAVIRATQDTSSWPLIDPLPSYGRGRELPGGRYMSFIHGNQLQDVIITGVLLLFITTVVVGIYTYRIGLTYSVSAIIGCYFCFYFHYIANQCIRRYHQNYFD